MMIFSDEGFEGQVGEPVVKSFRATPAWKALADAAFIAMPSASGSMQLPVSRKVECEIPAKWVLIIVVSARMRDDVYYYDVTE